MTERLLILVACAALYGVLAGVMYAVLVNVFGWSETTSPGSTLPLSVVAAGLWPITGCAFLVWCLLVLPARTSTRATKRLIDSIDEPRRGRPKPKPEPHKPKTF